MLSDAPLVESSSRVSCRPSRTKTFQPIRQSSVPPGVVAENSMVDRPA